MSIKLNQNITIEQRHELVMTPDLIQSVKILNYNLMELDRFVKEQIKENPVLEQADSVYEMQLKNNYKETFIEEGYKSGCYDNEFYSFENYVSADESLEEHLLMQLEVSTKSEEVIRVGQYLIESLDENGYLTVTLKSVSESLGVEIDAVKKVLMLLHTFDPYGVGARNLAECLAIQLKHAGLLNSHYIELLKNHMDDFSANKLKKISDEMKIPLGELQQMADIIRHLEPKPGRQYSKDYNKQYIIPEIIVEETDGKYTVFYQDNYTPQLMISSYYESVLAEHSENAEVLKYIKGRIESASRLISNIEKRKQTIHKVAQAIVDYQHDFFRKGDKGLRPMTLRMIAEKINMHESTVSRAVNGKYLQCHRGVFELRYLFSE